jgi:hypothetical protein
VAVAEDGARRDFNVGLDPAEFDDGRLGNDDRVGDDGAEDGAVVAEPHLFGQLPIQAEGIDVLEHGADVVKLGVWQCEDLHEDTKLKVAVCFGLV